MAMTRKIAEDSHELIIVSIQAEELDVRIRYRGNLSSHTSWSTEGNRLLVGI